MNMILIITKLKNKNGWFLLNKMFYVLLSLMLDIVKRWKKLLDLVWKIVYLILVWDGNFLIVCVIKMTNQYTLIMTNTWDGLFVNQYMEIVSVLLINIINQKFFMKF